MSRRPSRMKEMPSLTGHRPFRPQNEGNPGARPTSNEAESPLAWLRARRGKAGEALISDMQFLAGEKLRQDFERAHLHGRVTTNWDLSATAGRGAGNVTADVSDRALAARERYHRALAAVGPELSGILVPICCLASVSVRKVIESLESLGTLVSWRELPRKPTEHWNCWNLVLFVFCVKPKQIAAHFPDGHSGLEQAERLLHLPQRSGKAVLGLALTALARHYGLRDMNLRAAAKSRSWGLPDYRPALLTPEEV